MVKDVVITPEDIIYVEDVIAIFGGKVTKRIIYNLVREKKLPAYKAGNRFLFSRKKVELFVAKHLGLAS